MDKAKVLVFEGLAVTTMLERLDDQTLERVAARLREGDLVAFPTETVYGLGANASDFNAVQSVYKVKGRPAQDPLIVHCSSLEQTKKYISDGATQWQRRVHEILGHRFWPGPLTIVLPSNSNLIVSQVTGKTDWVGLRCPDHPIALRLLEFANCPVAAPSANLFGHVSPTTAKHVYDDFPDVDNLWIVDGGVCGFGLESTVVRLNINQTLDVLRRGGVGCDELIQCLVHERLFSSYEDGLMNVRVVERYVKETNSLPFMASPGQLLVHYSPRIDTRMVVWADDISPDSHFELVFSEQLQKTILIDFSGRFSSLAHIVGIYRDLSYCGSSMDAAHSLFSVLRWAEDAVEKDSCSWQILIFDPRAFLSHQSDEVFLALADRIFRAAAGRSVRILFKPDSGQVFSSVR